MVDATSKVSDCIPPWPKLAIHSLSDSWPSVARFFLPVVAAVVTWARMSCEMRVSCSLA